MLLNQYSLLAHVTPGLTAQLENLATESLLYLLQRYERAHEAFVELASSVGYAGPREFNSVPKSICSTGASRTSLARPLTGRTSCWSNRSSGRRLPQTSRLAT